MTAPLELIIKIAIILAGAALIHYTLLRSIHLIIGRLNDRGYQTTRIRFIKNSLGFIIYGIAIILMLYDIPQFKSLSKSLLAGAGIFAAIIGFASKEAFADIMNGIFIIIYKPFQIGDTIELENSLKGVVHDITFRHTIIKDFENREIIIPNTKIGDSTIINSTLDQGAIRKQINFSIGYESDEDKAIEIIRQTIENHPNSLDKRSEKEKKDGAYMVDVRLTEWLASGINLRAYVWTPTNADSFVLQCDVLAEVKKKFKKENIEIPYPQIKIHQ